jgi:hypothetical protein
MGIQILLAQRRRVADQLSSRRIRLSDLEARLFDCPVEETRAAIEQESEVCRQLAGKFLQLQATILARQIWPRTPRKQVGAPRSGSGPKSDRLSVRLALLDGSR